VTKNEKEGRPKYWGGAYWKFLREMRKIHPDLRPYVYERLTKNLKKTRIIVCEERKS